MDKKYLVFVLLIVLLSVSVVGCSSSEKEFILEEGDYITYDVSGFVPLLGNINGTMEYRFTNITDDTVTRTMYPSGDVAAIINQESKTKDRDEPLLGNETRIEEGEHIGTEDVKTDIGIIQTEHYLYTDEGGNTTDLYIIYIKEEPKFTIKKFAELEHGTTMNIVLSDTNIEYLKDITE